MLQLRCPAGVQQHTGAGKTTECSACCILRLPQRVCDAHDPGFYPRFKQWADDYFLCKHRGQRRGLGGIFFDDLNDRPQDDVRA